MKLYLGRRQWHCFFRIKNVMILSEFQNENKGLFFVQDFTINCFWRIEYFLWFRYISAVTTYCRNFFSEYHTVKPLYFNRSNHLKYSIRLTKIQEFDREFYENSCQISLILMLLLLIFQRHRLLKFPKLSEIILSNESILIKKYSHKTPSLHIWIQLLIFWFMISKISGNTRWFGEKVILSAV